MTNKRCARFILTFYFGRKRRDYVKVFLMWPNECSARWSRKIEQKVMRMAFTTIQSQPTTKTCFPLCQWRRLESRGDKLQIYSIQIVNCSRRDIFNEAYFTFCIMEHVLVVFIFNISMSSSCDHLKHRKRWWAIYESRAKSIEQRQWPHTNSKWMQNQPSTATTTKTSLQLSCQVRIFHSLTFSNFHNNSK